MQLVLSNSPKLRAPRQKAQNESSQHKKKGNSSHKLKQKLCSKKNVNQTHNLIHNVSENAKYTCENPAILQDPTVPATEDSVQIHPNVCLRGILWITSSPDLSMANNITFDESVMEQNLKRSTAIYNNIRTKFVPKYWEIFPTLYLRIGAVGLTVSKSYGALKELFVRLQLLSCPARCQHEWI